MSDDAYLTVNRANWDSRVSFHEQGYGLDRFRGDPSHLSGVVRFDLRRLGDVRGLDFSEPALAARSSTLCGPPG